MDWKGITALVLLGFVVGALGVFMISRVQHGRWLVREKELVEESARWQYLASVHDKRADMALGRAAESQAQADVAIAELEAIKAGRKRRKPTTLKECEEDFDAALLVADRSISYLRVTNGNLSDAIAEKDEQISSLNNALTTEHERAEGWKRHTKRAKIKQAFFGIGMAGAGVLLGYGGAQVAK